MTVLSTSNRISFAGNGVTTVFATSPMVFFAASELQVYVVVNATGVATLRIITTHYTVSGGAGGTGTVTMVTAPASGETLLILRVLPITQGADFVNNDGSDAEVAEDSLDKGVMISQQLQEQANRALLLPVGTTLTNVAMPAPETGKFVRGNPASTGFENATITGLGSIGVPVAIVDGGTGVTTAAAARTSLDVTQAIASLTAETDVAEGDSVAIRDTSEGADNKATVQNLFNVINGMTAFSGDPDPDNDQMVVYDNSQSAPKQRKVPFRIGQVPVRQTALAGNVDANGYANFITTGSGLRPGLLATSDPLVLTSAAGFDSLGEKNYIERFTADVSDIFGFDAIANVTNFIYRTLGSGWDRALVPPQDGYAFDRTQNAQLNFNGADASTAMLDDFGNTWTATGNAQLDTAQAKFGSASLLLDGTGDYITSTDFKTLGGDSWEMSCWFHANATSGLHTIANAGTTTAFGIALYLDHNAGSRRLRADFSSNGTSTDIGTFNGTTTTIALATWHKVRVVFDALAGTYRAYLSVNGAAESQEGSISSTARLCGLTGGIRIGSQLNVANDFNGWIDSFAFHRCVASPATETPSASEPVVTNFPVHFFSLPRMQMFEVTGVAPGAGQDPVLTARNRVFVAEADTSGAAVTAVRTYALRGEYRSALTALPASAARAAFQHNIGSLPLLVNYELVNLTTQFGFVPGDVVPTSYGYFDSATGSLIADTNRNSAGLTFSTAIAMSGKGAAGGVITTANWNYRMNAKKGW